MHQAPSINIQAVSCQAIGNCQSRSPIRAWNNKYVLTHCVHFSTSISSASNVCYKEPTSSEGTHRLLSLLSVQIHDEVPAAQQKLLAGTKSRQGKIKGYDWEPPRKERILLEPLFVDEASSSSETKESSLAFLLVKIWLQINRYHLKPPMPDLQLHCPSSGTDLSVGWARTLGCGSRSGSNPSARKRGKGHGEVTLLTTFHA